MNSLCTFIQLSCCELHFMNYFINKHQTSSVPPVPLKSKMTIKASNNRNSVTSQSINSLHSAARSSRFSINIFAAEQVPSSYLRQLCLRKIALAWLTKNSLPLNKNWLFLMHRNLITSVPFKVIHEFYVLSSVLRWMERSYNELQLSCTRWKLHWKPVGRQNKQRNKIVTSRKNIKSVFEHGKCVRRASGRAIVKTHKFTKLAVIVHKTVSKKH